MPIAVYIYFAIEFDSRLGNFPYREPLARWWEGRLCFLFYLLMCILYISGIGFLLAFFARWVTWGFLAMSVAVFVALGEGIVPKGKVGARAIDSTNPGEAAPLSVAADSESQNRMND